MSRCLFCQRRRHQHARLLAGKRRRVLLCHMLYRYRFHHCFPFCADEKIHARAMALLLYGERHPFILLCLSLMPVSMPPAIILMLHEKRACYAEGWRRLIYSAQDAREPEGRQYVRRYLLLVKAQQRAPQCAMPVGMSYRETQATAQQAFMSRFTIFYHLLIAAQSLILSRVVYLRMPLTFRARHIAITPDMPCCCLRESTSVMLYRRLPARRPPASPVNANAQCARYAREWSMFSG